MHNKDKFVRELNEAMLYALNKAIEEYKKIQDETNDKTIRTIKLRHTAGKALLDYIMKLIETIGLMEMEGLATDELKEKIAEAQEQIFKDTGKRSSDA